MPPIRLPLTPSSPRRVPPHARVLAVGHTGWCSRTSRGCAEGSHARGKRTSAPAAARRHQSLAYTRTHTHMILRPRTHHGTTIGTPRCSGGPAHTSPHAVCSLTLERLRRLTHALTRSQPTLTARTPEASPHTHHAAAGGSRTRRAHSPCSPPPPWTTPSRPPTDSLRELPGRIGPHTRIRPVRLLGGPAAPPSPHMAHGERIRWRWYGGSRCSPYGRT